jgi:hypothetical protein
MDEKYQNRAQVWAPFGAATLAIAATALLTASGRDPAFWVGVAFAVLSAYILLAVFVLPRLPLPPVRSGPHEPFLDVVFEGGGVKHTLAGSPFVLAGVSVRNTNRWDVRNATINLLLPQSVPKIEYSTEDGSLVGIGSVLSDSAERLHFNGQEEDAIFWSHRGFEFAGHVRTRHYWRVYVEKAGLYEMRMKIISADLPMPFVIDGEFDVTL